MSQPSHRPARVGRTRAAAGLAALLVVLTTTGAAPAAASSRPRRIPAASAFALPTVKECLGHGRLTFRVRTLRHVHWVSVTVAIDGRRVKTLTGSEIARAVTLTRLPATKAIVLSLSATARHRRHARVTRTYRVCGAARGPARPRAPRAPKPPTTTPPPPSPPAPSSPADGLYSGVNGQNGFGISLYLAAGGTKIQDVYDSSVSLSCLGGGRPFDHLGIDEIPIAPDGSFSSTTAQIGLFNGGAATYTYTFSGHLEGAGLAGTYREDVAYDGGASSCTSNVQPWSATRNSQPAPPTSPPPPGSYSGVNGQNGFGISFFVNVGSSQIQDVYDSSVSLSCLGGGRTFDHLGIDEIPIAPDGSFSSATTQIGLFNGGPATYTYALRGHFHGNDNAGFRHAAGTYREDVDYAGGTSHCISHNQSWSATLSTQPAQTAGAPPGSYSGVNGQNGFGFSFTVSADSQHVLDVLDDTVALACSGRSGTTPDQLTVDDVPIAPDGSFSSTTSHSGSFSGRAATFTYTLRGHFHGNDNAGTHRAAGTYREDVDYDAGASHCTSHNQSWSATN
jgi:hypothetical protein